MRTVSTNLYTYDELSDKARSKARDWWRNLEANDPPWLEDYRDSERAALKFIRLYSRPDNLDELYAATEAMRADPDKSCPWTGNSPDEVAIDAILAAKNQGYETSNQVCAKVEKAMSAAWDDEVAYAMSEANVEDTILAHGYEFTVNGIFAP